VTRLEVAPRAEAQIRRVSDWWRANRPAAPELFARELARALETLVEAPGSGVRYGERRGVAIRRLLLRKSSYHVYFSYDQVGDVVSVRAVWHAARGVGPSLA
jgi:plasmid stabilization system protein ParE